MTTFPRTQANDHSHTPPPDKQLPSTGVVCSLMEPGDRRLDKFRHAEQHKSPHIHTICTVPGGETQPKRCVFYRKENGFLVSSGRARGSSSAEASPDPRSCPSVPVECWGGGAARKSDFDRRDIQALDASGRRFQGATLGVGRYAPADRGSRVLFSVSVASVESSSCCANQNRPWPSLQGKCAAARCSPKNRLQKIAGPTDTPMPQGLSGPTVRRVNGDSPPENPNVRLLTGSPRKVRAMSGLKVSSRYAASLIAKSEFARPTALASLVRPSRREAAANQGGCHEVATPVFHFEPCNASGNAAGLKAQGVTAGRVTARNSNNHHGTGAIVLTTLDDGANSRRLTWIRRRVRATLEGEGSAKDRNSGCLAARAVIYRARTGASHRALQFILQRPGAGAFLLCLSGASVREIPAPFRAVLDKACERSRPTCQSRYLFANASDATGERRATVIGGAALTRHRTQFSSGERTDEALAREHQTRLRKHSASMQAGMGSERSSLTRNHSRGRTESIVLPSVRVAGVTVGSLVRLQARIGVSQAPRIQTAAIKSGHTVAANPARGCGCASLLKATNGGVAPAPRETSSFRVSGNTKNEIPTAAPDRLRSTDQTHNAVNRIAQSDRRRSWGADSIA